MAPLAAEYPQRVNAPLWTFENFRAASTLMSSRAFFVDEHHGEAMVPVADAFNHKAAIVALGGYDAAEEDSDGSEEEIEGGDEDEEEEEEGEGALHGCN